MEETKLEGLKHVRMLPDSIAAEAAGLPFAEVTLGGKRFLVRCASIADIGMVEQITGKRILLGEVNPIRDLTTLQLIDFAEMALRKEDGAPIDKGWLGTLPVRHVTAPMFEVLAAFLRGAQAGAP